MAAGGLAAWRMSDRKGVSRGQAAQIVQRKFGKTLGRLSLVAVGDLAAAGNADGLSSSLMTDVGPIVGDADVIYGNLALPTGRAFLLNGPSAVSRAYSALDRGPLPYYREPVARLSAERIAVLGAGRTRIDMERAAYQTRDGIRYATLAFSDDLNVSLTKRGSTKGWTQRLDLEPTVVAVEEARTQADVVVVLVEWGNEHQSKPTPRQRRIATRLVAAGADLVLGHLPGVLQPIEVLRDGGRKAVVAYSLGNVAPGNGANAGGDVYAQSRGDTKDAAALKIEFAKVKTGNNDGDQAIVIDDIAYEPLWLDVPEPGQADRPHIIPIVKAANDVLEAIDQAVEAKEEASSSVTPSAQRLAARKMVEMQEELRGLLTRRERVANTLGEVLELNRQLKGVKGPDTEPAKAPKARKRRR